LEDKFNKTMDDSYLFDLQIRFAIISMLSFSVERNLKNEKYNSE